LRSEIALAIQPSVAATG